MSKAIALINNLSLDYVKLFNPHVFQAANRFALNNPSSDPNVPDRLLNLGYTQPGGWAPPSIEPKEQPRYRWEFGSYSTAIVTNLSQKNAHSEEVELTRRAELSKEQIGWMKTHPLVIDPIVAALAVYDLGKIKGDSFPPEAYDIEGSDRVIRFLLSFDPELAPNIYLEKMDGIEHFFGLALLMDTACRNDAMSPEFIRFAVDHLINTFPGATQWIGCGTENILPSDARRPYALRDGFGLEAYIRCRLEQIEYVLEKGKIPILFPSPMQQGYDKNLVALKRILERHLNKIVLHKLREPFNKDTNYLDIELLKEVVNLAYAVKTSDPRYDKQIEDYAAVQSVPKDGFRPVMHTGDDRGTFFTLWKGVDELVKKIQRGEKPETYTRNGFTFYRDVNISALLGNIGLNPINFIYLILMASKYVDAKINGKEKEALEYELKYWKHAASYTGYSTDCFFGKNEPTPKYTQKVWLANRILGVLREEDGVVLQNRQSHWQDETNRRVLNSRFAALACFAGLVNVEEIEGIIAKNSDLFLLHES